MQKHTSAYYGLMLIGLIYSIPSAPMAYRIGTSTRQVTTPTIRQPYATLPREVTTRRFYGENYPPKGFLLSAWEKWWNGLTAPTLNPRLDSSNAHRRAADLLSEKSREDQYNRSQITRQQQDLAWRHTYVPFGEGSLGAAEASEAQTERERDLEGKFAGTRDELLKKRELREGLNKYALPQYAPKKFRMTPRDEMENEQLARMKKAYSEIKSRQPWATIYWKEMGERQKASTKGPRKNNPEI
jgi:hypothetical protein